VAGKSNEFAQAASRAVDERPHRPTTPIFSMVESGMGKTALEGMPSAHHQERTPASASVLQAEKCHHRSQFNSISLRRMISFRYSFPHRRRLLVDDIQFIGRKERTRKSSSTLSTRFTEQQKQIVISSDACPKNIQCQKNACARDSKGDMRRHPAPRSRKLTSPSSRRK